MFLLCEESLSECIISHLALSFMLRLMHGPETRAQRCVRSTCVVLCTLVFSAHCRSRLVFEAVCCSSEDEPHNVFI